jgi:hypothetical protein
MSLSNSLFCLRAANQAFANKAKRRKHLVFAKTKKEENILKRLELK